MRLLIIDHFDSYTLNLLSLLPVGVSVVVLPHTHPLLAPAAFAKEVRPYIDAIVLSPGPGTPENEADFGAAAKLLRDDELGLPVLGVCLGHQGMATAFGGRVVRARSVRHGLKSAIHSPKGFLLKGVPEGAEVVRYNSLTVDPETLPPCLTVTAWGYDEPCPAPAPRSTTYVSGRSSPSSLGELDEDLTATGTDRQPVILALEHRSRPLYGVQFHPESVESDYGKEIVQNFLEIVERFWGGKRGGLPEHLVQAGRACVAPGAKAVPMQSVFRVQQRTLSLPPFDGAKAAPEIFRRLFRSKTQVGAAWLDSARPKDPHSRFSYMAVPSFVLSYHACTRRFHLDAAGDDGNSIPIHTPTTMWDFMDQLQTQLQQRTHLEAPDANLFRTGFVGYWGYEMKNESLGLDSQLPKDERNKPDAEFMFCEKVLAYDHHLDTWTTFVLTAEEEVQAEGALGQVQSALRQARQGGRIGLDPKQADAWLREVTEVLESMPDVVPSLTTPNRDALPPLRPDFTPEEYMDRIESAREEIAAGESYELCLTTQFRGVMPPLPSKATRDELDHFGLYLKLRARNPAPYSAFLRLPSRAGQEARGRAVVCTSPERFLRLTAGGSVEMKPIKGTLSRAGYGPGEEHMRHGTSEEEVLWRNSEDARRRDRLSADVKERAENLMIVDLIRADLFSFCQQETVKVPDLIKVESYETVHQLVTTVTGEVKQGVGPVEAVRRCFPPGSMTGAPKRRSVQLLEGLEAGRRGIYSGALGWMGVDGAADYAVVIRTLIAEGDELSIGAGGAITYLSDPSSEWAEVKDKVGALAFIPA